MNHPINTGPQGQLAARKLVEQRRRPQVGIFAIAPRIWTITGITGVNHHVIDSPDGLIVIDSGPNAAVGTKVQEYIRNVSERPIAALVYTHSHFCFGSGSLLQDSTVPTIIHAHERCHANVCRTLSHEEPGLYFARMAQSGTLLPHEGPDADPVGFPAGLTGPRSYLPPTNTWRKNGRTGTIAGEPVTVFTEYPFDSDDQLLLHFTELRLVVHGHLSCNFPAIASNGGGRFRDPRPWLDGLDLILELQPKYLLGVHGPPVIGSDRICATVTEQRDALQFVYDQTVRAINHGITPREAVDRLELPETMAQSAGLHEDYAPWKYHIPAIYCGLMNWYSGDASELVPVEQQFESSAMVEGFGGMERMQQIIRSELDKGHYAWAARLARHCVRVNPQDPRARRLLAEALRAIGQTTESITTRAICLTQAREWEGKTSRRSTALEYDPALAAMAPPETWVRAMGFRLRPQRTPHPDCTITFSFPDRNSLCGLCIRRSVAVLLKPGQLPATPDYTVTLDTDTWLSWFLGKVDWHELLKSGKATSTQPASAWDALWKKFDPWPPYREPHCS